MTQVFSRMRALVQSGICDAQQVFKAFYFPGDTSCFSGKFARWGEKHEDQVAAMKKLLNSDFSALSNSKYDLRVMAQVLLDYFENFK